MRAVAMSGKQLLPAICLTSLAASRSTQMATGIIKTPPEGGVFVLCKPTWLKRHDLSSVKVTCFLIIEVQTNTIPMEKARCFTPSGSCFS